MENDEIVLTLQQYEREARSKRAVLLTPGGGYYLYDNHFCGLHDFELCLSGPDLQIQAQSVSCGLFFGVVGDTLAWSARNTGPLTADRLSLIFHIAFDSEDSLLRGILFANGSQAHMALFTDAEVEKLYRAVTTTAQGPPLAGMPDRELSDFAAECARNDLRRLTALYLHGRKLTQLREEVSEHDRSAV